MHHAQNTVKYKFSFSKNKTNIYKSDQRYKNGYRHIICNRGDGQKLQQNSRVRKTQKRTLAKTGRNSKPELSVKMVVYFLGKTGHKFTVYLPSPSSNQIRFSAPLHPLYILVPG